MNDMTKPCTIENQENYCVQWKIKCSKSWLRQDKTNSAKTESDIPCSRSPSWSANCKSYLRQQGLYWKYVWNSWDSDISHGSTTNEGAHNTWNYILDLPRFNGSQISNHSICSNHTIYSLVYRWLELVTWIHLGTWCI